MRSNALITISTVTLLCLVYHGVLVSGETTYVVAFLGQTSRGHHRHMPRSQTDNTSNVSGIHRRYNTGDSVTYTVVLTNTDNTDITVNITGIGGLFETLVIPVQKYMSRVFNDSHSLHGSQHANKSLIIASNGTFTLQTLVHNNHTGHTEGFLGVPIEALMGPPPLLGYYEYIVSSMCGVSGYCQFALAAWEDKTAVSVTLPPTVENIVLCIHGNYFQTNHSTWIKLYRYFAVQIETTQDLSGTRLYSRKPFVVFVGARNLTQNGVTGHVVEQLLPASLWGANYFVHSVGTRDTYDVIKIAANWANTTIRITGFPVFKIAHFSHVISRRINNNGTLIVQASKPIQVVQISGLVDNSSFSTFSPGLVVLTGIHQRMPNVTGYCSTNATFQLYMRGGFTLQETPGFVDNLSYSGQAFVLASLKSKSVGLYNLTSTLKHSFGGIMQCGTSAIMPINYPHYVSTNNTGQSSNRSSPAGGGNFDTCTDGLEAMTTPRGRAHVIDISAYRLLRVRVQSCGDVMFKFYQTTPQSLHHVTRHAYEVMFEAGQNKFSALNCSDSCTRIVSTERKPRRNSYHRAINCSDDMMSYWFSVTALVNGSKICGGPGSFQGKHRTCVEMTSLKPNRLALSGAHSDAYFNYDLENRNCKHRISAWRCEDRISNCTDYPVTYCNDSKYPDFADRMCPYFCRKCTPDSSGRDFRVVLPISAHNSYIDECKIFVLSKEPGTKVSVGINDNALLVTRINGKYAFYDCLSQHTRIVLKQPEVVVIMSNRDVTVTVFVSTGSKIPIVYTAYPVDALGTMYTLFTGGFAPCSCHVVSVTGTSVDIEYENRNGTNRTHNQTIYVEPSKPYMIGGASNGSGTCNVGRQIKSGKPVGVFCGNSVGDVANHSYYQLQPIWALGTHYLTPKLSFHDLSKSISATLVIQGVSYPASFEIRNSTMSNSFVIQTEFHLPIKTRSVYNITSFGRIAAGIYFSESSGNNGQFIPLPPNRGFVSNASIGLPLSYLKSDMYNVSDITTYAVTIGRTFKVTAAPMNSTSALYNLRRSGSPQFSITVLTGHHRWFLLPFPANLVNDTRKKVETIPCVTSFPVVGDNVDNDCDGLIDEDTCSFGYGMLATDHDLDGASNEDCATVSNSSPIAKPPKMPHCFRIPHSHLTECWTPCTCPCSWKTNLENFNKMTGVERDDFAVQSNEKFRQLLQVNKESLSKTKSTKLTTPDHRLSAKGIGLGGVGLVIAFLSIIVILDMRSIVNALWTFYDNLSSVCTSTTQRQRRLSRAQKVEPLKGIQT